MNKNLCNHVLMNLPDRPLEGQEKILLRDIINAIGRPDAIVEDIIVGSKL